MEIIRDLKQDHIILRRIRDITKKCSDKLYNDIDIPIEDIEIITVIIEEFVDRFHHSKEELSYFPGKQNKDSIIDEYIHKFLIEHEFGRRIAKMLQRSLKAWRDDKTKKESIEPVARFLRTYSIFITDHTNKEDIFFDLITKNKNMKDDEKLIVSYANCLNQANINVRTSEMIKLIEYLESRDWMKS